MGPPLEEGELLLQSAESLLADGCPEQALSILAKADRKFPGGLKGLPELTAVAKVCLAALSSFRPSSQSEGPQLGICNCLPGVMKSSAFVDWYHVLQVESNADDALIKKQYRRLILLLHPDKNPHKRAEDAFKLVSQAYTVLCNPSKRNMFLQQRNHVTGACGMNKSSSSFSNGLYNNSYNNSNHRRAGTARRSASPSPVPHPKPTPASAHSPAGNTNGSNSFHQRYYSPGSAGFARRSPSPNPMPDSDPASHAGGSSRDRVSGSSPRADRRSASPSNFHTFSRQTERRSPSPGPRVPGGIGIGSADLAGLDREWEEKKERWGKEMAQARQKAQARKEAWDRERKNTKQKEKEKEKIGVPEEAAVRRKEPKGTPAASVLTAPDSEVQMAPGPTSAPPSAAAAAAMKSGKQEGGVGAEPLPTPVSEPLEQEQEQQQEQRADKEREENGATTDHSATSSVPLFADVLCGKETECGSSSSSSSNFSAQNPISERKEWRRGRLRQTERQRQREQSRIRSVEVSENFEGGERVARTPPREEGKKGREGEEDEVSRSGKKTRVVDNPQLEHQHCSLGGEMPATSSPSSSPSASVLPSAGGKSRNKRIPRVKQRLQFGVEKTEISKKEPPAFSLPFVSASVADTVVENGGSGWRSSAVGSSSTVPNSPASRPAMATGSTTPLSLSSSTEKTLKLAAEALARARFAMGRSNSLSKSSCSLSAQGESVFTFGSSGGSGSGSKEGEGGGLEDSTAGRAVGGGTQPGAGVEKTSEGLPAGTVSPCPAVQGLYRGSSDASRRATEAIAAAYAAKANAQRVLSGRTGLSHTKSMPADVGAERSAAGEGEGGGSISQTVADGGQVIRSSSEEEDTGETAGSAKVVVAGEASNGSWNTVIKPAEAKQAPKDNAHNAVHYSIEAAEALKENVSESVHRDQQDGQESRNSKNKELSAADLTMQHVAAPVLNGKRPAEKSQNVNKGKKGFHFPWIKLPFWSRKPSNNLPPHQVVS